MLQYKAMAASTVQGYKSSYHKHIEAYWAEWELHEIRVKHINGWLSTIPTPGGAEKAYKTLRQIIRSSIADEIYPEQIVDPTTRAIRLPRIPWRGEPQHLTPRQSKDLLIALEGWEYELLVICGLWLGLRRCEACGLQWGDINLKTGIVHIGRGLQYIDREVIVTEVKSHRSMRPHMLPRVAVQRLREIKRQLRPKPTDWLMGTGDAVNPDRYARRLKAHCKRIGVTCVAPKFFRHTFKSNMRKADVPEQDVQKMMGHRDFATQFIYMHLDEEVLAKDQKAHERLIMRA